MESENTNPLALAGFVIGSPAVGGILGLVFVKESCSFVSSAGSICGSEFNTEAGAYATLAGWLIGAVYEAAFEENAAAGFLLGALAVVALIVALAS